MNGKHKCVLCHICPTFLGVCCYIWLAVFAAVIVILIRKKKLRKHKKKTMAAE